MRTLHPSPARLRLPTAALAAVALLAACGSPAETAADNPPAVTAAADSGRTPPGAGTAVRQALPPAGAAAAGTAKDLVTTAEVSTLLTRDNQLSALKIDVDTRAGQVVLRGAAPSDAARSRAADLARSVGGVLAVENKLQVVPN